MPPSLESPVASVPATRRPILPLLTPHPLDLVTWESAKSANDGAAGEPPEDAAAAPDLGADLSADLRTAPRAELRAAPRTDLQGAIRLALRPAGGAAALGLAGGLAACSDGHVGTPGPGTTVQITGLPGSGGNEPASPSVQPGAVDASRFLAQASFGARSQEEVDALCTEGYEHWLWRQFNAPTLLHVSYLDWQRQRSADLSASADMAYEAIWQQFVAGADSLRARVTFALSQILVISNTAPNLPAYALSSWWDTLNRHAFGNYRELLQAVTLHPAMGRFLDMLGSEKANTRTGAHPNENYAREFLQLFTVGLVQLEADGSVKRDASGQPLPTYDEGVVQGYARAFTGWTFAKASGFHSADRKDEANWRLPMAAWPDFHSTGDIALLAGRTITASTPQADLAAAIDAAFQHPNVGPFIGRQLIQRLVTSNPSAAYVGRVAAAFADNGAGVRGDLRAVVRAILLDPEARDPSLRASGRAGKLREPVLRLALLLRGLGARNDAGRTAIHELDDADSSLGQSPLLAPSVFNFFSPGYRPAGAIAAAGLVAPEFQIATEASVPAGISFLRRVITGGGIGSGEGRLRLDLDPWLALADRPEALVDRIDLVFCNLQMSAGLRQRLLGLVSVITAGRSRDRVLAALTLTLLSPDHLVQA